MSGVSVASANVPLIFSGMSCARAIEPALERTRRRLKGALHVNIAPEILIDDEVAQRFLADGIVHLVEDMLLPVGQIQGIEVFCYVHRGNEL